MAGPTPFNMESVFTAFSIEGIVAGYAISEKAVSLVDFTSTSELLDINCCNRGLNLPRDLY